MKKATPSGGMNFWPGYVDAMTNVVLNLLFMVAMFGIALTVFNSTPRSNTLGKSDAGATAPVRPGDSTSGPVPNGVDGSVMTGNVSKGLGSPSGRLSGPAGSQTSRVGPNTGADSGTSTSRATGSQSPARGRGAGQGVASGTLAKGARTPSLRGDAGARGGEAARRGLLTDQPVIIVADAFERRGGPQVQVTRRSNPAGGALLVVDVPKGTEPFGAMSKPGIARLLREGVPADAGSVLVWTSTNLENPTERRAAFLALAATRNALIAAGIKPDSITTKLLQGSAGTPDAMQLFIQSITPGSNGEPSQPAAAVAMKKAEDVL